MVDKNFLKNKYGNEQVLVTLRFSTSDIPDGFTQGQKYNNIFQTANKFIYRYDAEYNLAVVQLIPYTLVTNTAEDKLFVTERIAGEERLQQKLSLGSGGHVNPEDFSDDTLLTAAVRELNEELEISLKEKPVRYGTVRDFNSTTDDHLGLVFVVHSDNVQVKEKDILKGQWFNMSDLVDNFYKLESWAKLIADHLFLNNKQYGKLFPELGVKKNGQKRNKKVR